jgi:hypothetical protein
VASGAMFFLTDFYYILPVYAICGIMTTAITTLPYQMVSEFHEDTNYRSQSNPGTKRGLGIDCSLLSSMFFLSQALVSIFMSLLISAFGNYVILIVASVTSFLGCFWISLFVIFPDSASDTTSASANNNNNGGATVTI